MATYKVIQDIEAEDKLLGPFGLRQFIYLVICVGLLFMCYLLISRAGMVGLLFTPIFLAPAAFLGFLAFPFSKDQPTELWMLARINFLFRPRKRIWNQSGARELVSITAPKHEERQYTNNLSQHEVHSRLQALAETLDSRGWAAKNAGQAYVSPLNANPDRLVDAGALPQEVATEVYTDNFDPAAQANPVAQHFDDMLQANAQQRRQQLMQQMQAPIPEPTAQSPAPTPAATPPQDFWFMQQQPTPAPATDVPADNVMFNSKVVNPGSDDDSSTAQSADEGELLDELKAHDAAKPQVSSHLPTIQPLDVQRREAEQRQQELARTQAQAVEQDAVSAARAAAAAAYIQPTADAPSPSPTEQLESLPAAVTNPPKPVTPADNTAILDFVNNDDLDIATISRQVNKPHQNADGSVEISLH